MDGSSFDKLVKVTTSLASRRSVMASGLVSAFAGLGAASLLSLGEADARKKRRHKKRCKKAGKACSSDKQCCPGKTHRKCDVPQNGSNSDTFCCGVEGAKGGGVDYNGDALAPFCCVGKHDFVCSENDENNPFVPGTCIPIADEI